MDYQKLTLSLGVLLLTLCAVSSASPIGDYGWQPDYQKLGARMGLRLLTSTANFAADGSVQNITDNGGQALQLSDTTFYLEPEFGIAPDWSLGLSLNFMGSGAKPLGGTTALMSGSGFGDSYGSLKWNLLGQVPSITVEVFVKIPTGNSIATNTASLVLGDGNIDLGFVLHAGTRAGNFRFSVSPGFLARFGGYSSAAIGDASIRWEFGRGFLQAQTNGIYSIMQAPLFDSSATVHDARGSAGSYLRLNGNPIGITGGGKIGIKFYENWTLEAAVDAGVWGMDYPGYYRVTVSLFNLFDFFSQPKKVKVREIPLDSESTEGIY